MHVSAILSIKNLYAASNFVSRDEFRKFVMPIARQLKGVQALEWIPKVAAKDRAKFEQAARDDGIIGFTFTQRDAEGKIISAGKREDYFPIYYVEPVEQNFLALGFDLGSNAARLQALQRANKTGKTVATAPLVLVQETGKQLAYLILASVYRDKLLQGYSLGVYRLQTMIGTPLKHLQSLNKVNYYVFDVDETTGETLIHKHDAGATTDRKNLKLKDVMTGLHTVRTFKIAGRTWKVVFQPGKHLYASGYNATSVVTLVLGLLITLLITAYFWTMQLKTEQAQQLLTEKVQELFHSNKELEVNRERISAVVNSISDSIITIDSRGIIQSVNAATAEMFGHEGTDLIGEKFEILIADSDADSHVNNIHTYLQTGAASENGWRRQLQGLRLDGSIFAIELQISYLGAPGENLFLGMIRDITEQLEAERLKTEFISTVSHELRTPLTAISGALGMVSSGMFGELPTKVSTMIELAVRNSIRLSDLVNDLLDIEKVQAGDMEFDIEELDVYSLIKKSLEVNQELARTQGVVCELTQVQGVFHAYADPHRLAQVVTCVLSNAFKFSPKGETVQISVHQLDTMIRIAIADKGPGIEEIHREKIYEQFIQIDSSDSRQQGGTGLGLNLSKSIMKELGGEISYEINEYGGATFFMDVPRQKKDQVVVEKIDIESMTRVFMSTPVDKPLGVEEVAEIPNILFVEDDLDIVQLVSIHLANTVKITSATTVEEAEKLLQAHSYSLVILDAGLPDGSGLALLEEIREMEDESIPVLVFSGNQMDHEFAEKVEATLVKTKVSTEELANSIKTLLKLAA